MFTNEIVSECETVSVGDLQEFETTYDFSIPDELKAFYLQYNGGKPRKRVVGLRDGEWESSTSFHGFYSMKNELENAIKNVYYENWWIKGLIPFGYDEGGEEFCFSTREHDYGSIYYFLSECIDEKEPENAFLKVSKSFSQFINDMD